VILLSTLACVAAQCCEGKNSAPWNARVASLKVPANTAAACTGKEWSLNADCPSERCNSFVCAAPNDNIDTNKFYGQRCETADSISGWVQGPDSLKNSMLQTNGVCSISRSDGTVLIQVNADKSMFKNTPLPCCVGKGIATSITSNRSITEIKGPDGNAVACTGKDWSLTASCGLGESCRDFWCLPCTQGKPFGQVACSVPDKYYGQVCASDSLVWDTIKTMMAAYQQTSLDCSQRPKSQTTAYFPTTTSDAPIMHGMGGFLSYAAASFASKVILSQYYVS
jgi:hypothetical protein